MCYTKALSRLYNSDKRASSSAKLVSHLRPLCRGRSD